MSNSPALIILALAAGLSGCADVQGPELPAFAVGDDRLTVTQASPLSWSALTVDSVGECNVELHSSGDVHRRPLHTSAFDVDAQVQLGDALVVIERHHGCRIIIQHDGEHVFAWQFTDA